MTASFEGHVEVVRALIVSQALVNTQNEVGVYNNYSNNYY